MPTSGATELKAVTFRLDELVTDVRRGRIRVPHFQRAFRWESLDVLNLFDSVYRGFPIGTLLFWERPARAEEVALGNGAVRIQAPQRDDALWVVDGQQRITSLALSMSHDLFAGSVERRFQVVFDLRTEHFRLQRPSGDALELPVSTAFDLQKVLLWVGERGLSSDLQERAFGLAKRLRDYEVPAYLVATPDETVLRNIFDRLNTFGKRMKRAEVFQALNSIAGDESELGDLQQLRDRIASKGFGDIDDDLVLLMTLATRGGDVLRDFRGEFEPAELPSVFNATEAAFDRAAAFLRSEARLPHLRLLPYEYLLVGLVAFFAHHPAPSPRNRVRLRRWLWRSAVVGPASLGGYTPTLRRTGSVAAAADEESAISGLLGLVPVRQPNQLLVPKELRLNVAANRIAVASLATLVPRRIGGEGQEVDLEALLSEGTQGFARIFDRRTVGDSYNLLGNVLLMQQDIDVAEDALLVKLLRSPDTVLESHGIDARFVELTREGSATAAIALRQRQIVDLANATSQALAEWGMNDRPALDDLVLTASEP